MSENENFKITRFKEMIEDSRNIVFFGGAGVSTESGIPDFRSKDGLYNQKYEKDPEEILSKRCITAEPELFWKFYRDKLLIKNVEPNDAHKALAKLEKDGKLSAIVTQNIDNLHELAGSKNVYHIHGSIADNYCTHCGWPYSIEEIEEAPEAERPVMNRTTKVKGVPYCACGGMIRPGVVLYGESLPDDAWNKSCKAIKAADMLIVAGTSLMVYPANTLIDYFNYYSGKLVVINRESTKREREASLIIHDSIGKVLKEAILE